MNLTLSLSTLALRQLVDSARIAIGVKEGGEAAVTVADFLFKRFTDQSQRLTAALQNANARAWRALELSLAGDSWWERCKATVTRAAEDQTFAQQVRAFLDAAQWPELAKRTKFREQCLVELRAARKAGYLNGELRERELADKVGDFARFRDPLKLLDAEWQVVEDMASALKQANYSQLAWLLEHRPLDVNSERISILVVGVRYFFRRAVDEDEILARGLTFAQLDHLEKGQKVSFVKLDHLTKDQEEGFAKLDLAITQRGQRLAELLEDVYGVAIEVRNTANDSNARIRNLEQQNQQMLTRLNQLLAQRGLRNREVRPGDSCLRDDRERQFLKQEVARYRALSEAQRRRMPTLLNAVGKLEFVVGDFDAAQRDFQTVAAMEQDSGAKAQAHFNAYQTCLQKPQPDLTGAFQEFLKAVKLAPKRFATFPIDKYQPQRILGVGGFGVVFLCKNRDMGVYDAVKTLSLDDLGREPDKVLVEAQVLRQLDHPAIIRISNWGYADPAGKSHPYMVMDYFPGETLEEYVKKHGPLSVEDLLTVAGQMAEGLQAAHAARILHRDVKPANLLVRKEGSGWKVKIIDFGLAMPQKMIELSQRSSAARQKKTTIAASIAGTQDYGAPEQIGRRNDPLGSYSDVYGWAKTCCFALFQTTQPLMKHWQSIPISLAQLLEKCLDEDPKLRIQQFTVVLNHLQQVQNDLIPVAEWVENSIPEPVNKENKSSLPSPVSEEEVQLEITEAEEENDGSVIDDVGRALLLKAAEQGHALTQSFLDQLFHNGEVAEKDYSMAEMLLRKAADQGNDEVVKLLRKWKSPF